MYPERGKLKTTIRIGYVLGQPNVRNLHHVFSSPVQMYRKSYCTTIGVGGEGDSKTIFFIKVFFVMGKALIGELSYTGTGLFWF